MADKSKNRRLAESNTDRETRRRRVMQIVIAIFSILLILSLVLSLAVNT